ncbi:MAG TPA: type II secretion system protein GspC [Kofleriaceae bacterium]|nr:type II secretion system protein GspC [Kofleriaceae bacterium]
MQDLIKRYFWLLGGVVVVVCAIFAAKAASNILEAVLLGDSDHAIRVAVTAPSPATPVKQSRSKDGTPFAQRNMFCSECTPPVVVATDPSSIMTTSLPLVLLATNVGAKPEDSYATVINTESQHQGSFSVGDPIPGATGKLKEIHYKYIDFENNGHIERLVLQGAQAPVVAAVEPKPAEGDDLQAQIDNGVKKIDDSTYEIDKSLMDKALGNPMLFAKGARVVPAMTGGKASGFKLYAIRPDSVFAKLGLTNGDTLDAINGFQMTSMDQALEVYSKLREANSFQVDITRRGKQMTLKYNVR